MRPSIPTAEAPLVAVLAAGRAVRFGGGKLEAACAGKPLGRWALDTAVEAGLAPGIVVTGPEGASFAHGWETVINPDPAAGLGSSLALAARFARARGREALLVLLADMPLVPAEYLRQIARSAAPAATRYSDGRAGVPALVDRTLLDEAARLTGDRGAGPLLAGATLLDPPAGVLFDVDTPDDLPRAERRLRRARGVR